MLSVLLIAIAALSASCRSESPPAQPAAAKAVEERAYQWLVAHASPTGLVGNQEGDDFSGLYCNAAAAICFTHHGDVERARQMFAVFAQRCPSEFAPETPGGFHQFWNARTGDVFPDSDRWVGDNAWLLIALNHYRATTRDTQFDEMRDNIAKWLISLQDVDGGIRSGFNKAGPMMAKSTEGNLDSYAALTGYPENQAKILGWLKSQMFVAGEQRLRMGSTVDESPLDATSWGVASLGKDWTNLFSYTEQHFLRTDKTASGTNVTGFSDFLNKRRIWFEGTGQMIVAYNAAGEREKADRYLREMENVMLPSARFPDTVGLPCTSSDPPWDGGDRRIFVPSQAWYLFGKWRLNPMAQP